MGHRITRAASHLSVDEVKKRMSTHAHSGVRQRWWIIYNALVAPRKAEEIAQHTGVSATTVHRVIATYNRLGPAAVETPGKGGRRHQYLTWEEEGMHRYELTLFPRIHTGRATFTASGVPVFDVASQVLSLEV